MKNEYSESGSRTYGFTIVELLVVIVIIGILASITIVSYTGVANRAKVTAVKSDLTNNAKKIQLYYAEYGTYPTEFNGNCPSAPTADTKYCLQSGSDVDYTGGANSFALKITDSVDNSYQITEKGTPTVACPVGFITIPGSSTYGTSDFCVMKYEAKQVGSSNVPESIATSLPWVDISQTDAIAYSQNVEHCDGCHLISEAEWLTIAQNVLSVPSNWSGNAVGSGYMYSGNNDQNPNTKVAASTDTDGYANTNNHEDDASISFYMVGDSQRRTLTLTNGEVIWDLSGNVFEWTSGQSTGGQPGLIGDSVYDWREWNALTVSGSLSPNPLPSYGTPAASGWDTAQGIGALGSNSSETGLRAFFRGGARHSGANAGVLSLYLEYDPDFAGGTVGFRVTR